MGAGHARFGPIVEIGNQLTASQLMSLQSEGAGRRGAATVGVLPNDKIKLRRLAVAGWTKGMWRTSIIS